MGSASNYSRFWAPAARGRGTGARKAPETGPRSTPSWPARPAPSWRRSRATTRTSSLSDRPTRASPSSETAEPVFPTAAEYASVRACHGALIVVDLQAEQAAVTADYDKIGRAHV